MIILATSSVRPIAEAKAIAAIAIIYIIKVVRSFSMSIKCNSTPIDRNTVTAVSLNSKAAVCTFDSNILQTKVHRITKTKNAIWIIVIRRIYAVGNSWKLMKIGSKMKSLINDMELK